MAKGKNATKSAKKQIWVPFRDWSASITRTSDYHEPGYHRFYMNSTMFRISRGGDKHMLSRLKNVPIPRAHAKTYTEMH